MLIAACSQQQPEAQPVRFSFDEARHAAAIVAASPDTADAVWTVSADGQSIAFGKAGEKPLMSLDCRLQEQPAMLAVIRHAPAQPGLKAMFPVIGNGKISRFKADAVLNAGEWRWEGALPATDPLNDVFTGAGKLEATLPGAGSLQIGPSRIPAEFVDWCRQGGRLQRAQAEPAATPAEEPVPSPSPTPRL